MTKELWFDFRQGQKISLFSKMSRPALGLPTPVQWVLGTTVYPGVKKPGHEANHSPPFSPKVKNVWNCTFTPSYAFVACTMTTLFYFTLLYFTLLYFTLLYFTLLHFTLWQVKIFHLILALFLPCVDEKSSCTQKIETYFCLSFNQFEAYFVQFIL
jgi:hypothetical protein